MNLTAELMPVEWLVLSVPLWLLSVVWVWRHLPWGRLRREGFNLWGAVVVVLMLLWTMKAGVQPGLSLHFLGAMVATLVFGPALAMLALWAVMLGACIVGTADWSGYALSALALGSFPVMLAQGWFSWVDRYVPNNFFVFIFLNAFIGAGVVVFVTGALGCLLLWLSGAYPADTLLEGYLPYFILLGFSEAWLSGMTVTLMVVFRPGWVAAFDDQRYLRSK